MQLSEKAAAFLAKNPTKLGIVGGIAYYEHPDFGDEVPMFYIAGGKLCCSEHWDMESASEAYWNQF